MAGPTSAELLKGVQVKGSAYGKTQRLHDRSTEARELAVARAAYQIAKTLDAGGVPITEADADYLCGILRSRVGGQS